MKRTIALAAAATAALTASSSAAFLLDFSLGGATPSPVEPGWDAYTAEHEVSATFTTQSFNPTFAFTGAASVSITPDWPNTTDNRVRQLINRGNLTWDGNNFDLLRDWIGIDSRTNSGGNGPWDGTTGTPTYITIALAGLPAADYAMRTYHHDVENMNSFFTLEVSTDGGSTWGSIINARMTNSLAGGTPAENEVLQGTAPNVAGGDPADLTSTLNFGFTANGTNDVVLRFAPLNPANATTHQTFFGLDGFVLDQVPEPSAALLGLAGLALALRRRR